MGLSLHRRWRRRLGLGMVFFAESVDAFHAPWPLTGSGRPALRRPVSLSMQEQRERASVPQAESFSETSHHPHQEMPGFIGDLGVVDAERLAGEVLGDAVQHVESVTHDFGWCVWEGCEITEELGDEPIVELGEWRLVRHGRHEVLQQLVLHDPEAIEHEMGATTKSPAPSEEVVVVSDPHHGAVPASGAGGKPGLIVELRGNADEILSRLEASGLAVGRVIGAPVGEASATASAVATEPERDSQRASVGSPVAVAAAPAEGGAEQPEEGRAKERHRSYFGTPILEVVRMRSMVLAVLLCTQSLSSIVLSKYAGLIEQNVMLAVFLTMLTGTGGNAGNQSSALVIRGLSNGEINSSNYHRVVLREMLASSGIALVLAAISLVRVLVTPGASAMVALVISATTFLTVVGAVTGGTVVPLLLERMGVDPVHISSPVLATLTDVVGVLLLCLISSKFLLTAPL